MNALVSRVVFLMIGIIAVSCSYSTGRAPEIFEKRDSLGRLVEQWGNWHERDREEYFREFFYYNSRNLVQSTRAYYLDDENRDCVVTDTMDYFETRYEYDSLGWLLREKRFSPTFDETGAYLRHEPFDSLRY